MKAKEYIFDASYQPQVRAKRNTTNIMLDVIIALMPALIVGIWQFGVRVILYTVLSVASAVFFEWLYRKLMHKSNSIGDLSAALTGLLTVMILPSSSPWWILLIANLFAIVRVKQLYGGLGKNFLTWKELPEPRPCRTCIRVLQLYAGTVQLGRARRSESQRGCRYDVHSAFSDESRTGTAGLPHL